MNSRYKDMTLKGLKIELENNSNNLVQNLKEKKIFDLNIETLQEAFKNSNDNIYLIRSNCIEWDLSFTERSIIKCKENINTLQQLINDYREKSFIKNNTFISFGLITDMV